MIHTPSKHLSVQFLSELTKNNFISPKGIEYSEEEVRDALNEKQTRKGEQIFNDFIGSLRADDFSNVLHTFGGPPSYRERFPKPREVFVEGNNVIDLQSQLKRKKDEAEANSRLTCPHCEHTCESEDQFEMAGDTIDVDGRRDSGMLACPSCGHLTGRNVFDGTFEVTKAWWDLVKGDVQKVLASYEPNGDFNPVQALFNIPALRETIRKDVGDLWADVMYPDQYEATNG